MQSPTNKWQFPRNRIEQESPSRKDGVHLKLENSTRRLALAFGQDVGFMLKMNQYTIATATTYWQRFYMYQSLAKNDPYLIATACMLLAGKVEENFKSLQKITETAYYVRHKKEAAAAERIKKDPKLLLVEMDKVTKAEEVLLVTLDFDFSTSHPHGPLWKVVKELGLNTKGDRAKEHLCQIAWNFSNDSLRTTLCIQPHSSMDIAIACLNLAATAVHYELPHSPSAKQWWARFGTTKENLKDIERQVMALYKRRGEGDSSRTSGLSVPPTPSLPSATTQVFCNTPSPSTGAGAVGAGMKLELSVSGMAAMQRSAGKHVPPGPAAARPYEPQAMGTAALPNGNGAAPEHSLMASAKSEVTVNGVVESVRVSESAVEGPAAAAAVAVKSLGDFGKQLASQKGGEREGESQAEEHREGRDDKLRRDHGGGAKAPGETAVARQAPAPVAELPQEQEEVEMEVDEAEPAAAQPKGPTEKEEQSRPVAAAEAAVIPSESIMPELRGTVQEPSTKDVEETCSLQGKEADGTGQSLVEQTEEAGQAQALDLAEAARPKTNEAAKAKDLEEDAHLLVKGMKDGPYPGAGSLRETGGAVKEERGDAQGEDGSAGQGGQKADRMGDMRKGGREGGQAIGAENGPAASKDAAILEMDEELLTEIENVEPPKAKPATATATPGKSSGVEKGLDKAVGRPVALPVMVHTGATFVDVDASPLSMPVFSTFYVPATVASAAASRGSDLSALEKKASGADTGGPAGDFSRTGRMEKKRSRWDTDKDEMPAANAEASRGRRSEDGKMGRPHSVGKGEEAAPSRRAGSPPGRRPASPADRKRTRSPSPRRLPSPSRSGRSGGPSRERTPEKDWHRRPSPDSTTAKGGGAARGRSPGAERDRHRRSPDGWRHGERRREHERDDRGRGWDGHGRESRHRGHGHEQREKERDRDREYDRVDGDRGREGRDPKDKHRDGERERARYQRGHGYH